MSKPILHAEFLKAWADGEKLQFRNNSTDEHAHGWIDFDRGRHLWDFEARQLEFRIKPQTILINGIEVPEPVREPLEIGQEYFVCDMELENFGYACSWDAGSVDIRRLKRGLIHLTHEATQTYARALLTFAAKDE